ncbi:MAG: class I SAM-dependent methyltransferase [Planctomycetes bacterium]|nr:class I SAM-dependent methyltransferase [Planctomycetota bacterium]
MSPTSSLDNQTAPAGEALRITEQDLDELFRLKHGDPETTGWSPRRRYRFGYHQPADHYEAMVRKLVTPETDWIDIGGGGALFPDNQPLSKLLSERARRLVVVDPSDNIERNPFPHERVKCLIEDYQTEDRFDLATMRMVAEHITDPPSVVRTLSRLLRPGGNVVLFTVNRWAPVSVVSSLTPFWLHHPIKKLFFAEEDEKDTFPTVYRMNTRRRLKELFAECGFEERCFVRLDDLSVFARWKVLNYLELSAWRVLRRLRLGYPENCLLGVYRRT